MIRLKSLLFEVSLDQLKTQFVDTGKITDSEFTEIIDASGGKSAYATWLTKMVANKIIKPEDLYKYNSYFKIFDRRKREYQFQDINQYKTSQDISQFILKSVEIFDKEKSDPSQQKGVTRSNKYREFYIGSVEGFDVYELPKGRTDLYGVSCEMGSGTQWCTATGKTRKHFDSYISKGPLFIFSKPGSDEKYQFSYQTKNFMNKYDGTVLSAITYTSLADQTKLYNLFKFIESKRSKYKIPIEAKFLFNPNNLSKNDLKIRGDLNLYDSGVTSLPNGLTVTGHLHLDNNKIKSLPKNLTVGSISFSNNSIEKLPDDITIHDSLSIAHTPIRSLPDNLTIPGSLYINGNPMKSLPDNLTVGKNLYISNSDFDSFPKNLTVHGDMEFKRSAIASNYDVYSRDDIRKMIEDKGGSVNGRIIT
jgi:hypothetical protein